MPVGPARAAILAVYDDAVALPAPTTDTLDIQPRTVAVVRPGGPSPLARPGAVVTPTLAGPGQPGNVVTPAAAPAGPNAPTVAPVVYPISPRVSLWPTAQP